jgi:hypothetical protein
MADGDMARRPTIADDELRRIAATGDPVAAIYRQITGHAVRLHIPLKDPVQIRDVAKALRVLASAIEAESHSNAEAWRVLLRVRTMVQEFGLVIGSRKSR